MKFCNKEVFEKIDAYISANKDRILEDLLTLVRIPSVRGEPNITSPFGKECDEMLKETTSLYERHGFFGKINHEGGYAISYYGENKAKTIGIFSHGDIVPAEGEWLICPPFEPIIKDGYIFGRGCNDDKSGILQTVYAAEIIRELGFDLKSCLLMFTGANEESGMKDIDAFVKQEQMPDASIVPDGGYPCYSGERAILRFELVSKKKLDTIKKIEGGMAVNVTLGKVSAEISCDQNLISQIERACNNDSNFEISKDGSCVTIVAKGISNHTAHAENSLNAGKVLADMLTHCEALSDNDKSILKDLSLFLGDAFGTGFGIVHEDPIFGKLLCGNGIIKTTDDGSLSLSFDIRAGTSCDLDELKEKIQSATVNWEYHETRCDNGYYLSEDMPLRVLVEKTYAEVSGIKNAKSYTTAGGTHAKKLKNAVSIGTVGYYKAKNIDLPAGHGGVHQPDEKISIDGFLEAIKILVCIIMELDSSLNNETT